MTDDADRIRAEVERRKQRAWQLGLPDLTMRFYRDLARFYPAWRENHPDIVPQLISEIREVGKDTVEFGYQDDRYSLTWEERDTILPDGDLYSSCILSLLVDGSRVLEIYLHGDFNEYTGTDWRPRDVHAFIEGPWVASFKALVAEGERLHALYRQQAEDTRRRGEAEELKSRFGITTEDLENTKQIKDSCRAERRQNPERTLAWRLGALCGRLFRIIKK